MAQRWDRDRFERERHGSERFSERFDERDRFGPGPAPPGPRRNADVILDERMERRAPGRFEERERFFEEERLPPSRRAPAFLDEPIPPEVSRQALAPYRRPRPQYIRRQSSLDTFDRKPMPRYGEEYRLPAEVGIPLPIRRPRSPSQGRYYEEVDERYHDSDEDYHDVRVNRGSGRDRSRMRSRSVRRRRGSSVSSESSIETNKASIIGRKGRTKVPKRLAHKSAVIELGYPFVEEEDFIVVQRALDKPHIDKIVEISKKYREDKNVTYKYDGVREERDTVVEKEVIKEIKKEEVVLPPPPPPPPPMVIPQPNVVTVAPSVHHPVTEIIKKTTTTTTIDPPDHHHHHQDLAVVVPRHQSERDIQREIRALEAEAEALRLERRTYKDEDWETERRGKKEVYRVERNRKGRRSRSRPNPKVIGVAMAALT